MKFPSFLFLFLSLMFFSVESGAEQKPIHDEIDQIIQKMTFEEKVGQLLFVGFGGTEMDETIAGFFKQKKPGGAAFFSRNIKKLPQTLQLIRDVQALAPAGIPLFISVDQEGANVVRLQKYATVIPSNMAIGATQSEQLAFEAGKALGKDLSLMGFNMNLAPVLDVASNPKNPVIGIRAFSGNPDLVAQMGSAYVAGLQSEGVSAVAKHFPGHGRSKFDTHLRASIVNKGYKDLIKTDLVPFKLLDKSLMVMLAHIKYPLIDLKVATYSNEIIQNILRKKFNFKGLVVSDDISMKALKEDLQTKVTNCYKGGCDVVMYCKGNLNDMKLIYPLVNILEKKKMNYFFNERKKITLKRKINNKFKSDLIEYNLINNASKS